MMFSQGCSVTRPGGFQNFEGKALSDDIMGIVIQKAEHGDLDKVAPLFSQYRVFYEQSSSPEKERAYLDARMQRGECTILLASGEQGPAGFVLMYPTFDSVDLAGVCVLHDLFVAPDQRRKGIGRALMKAAHEFARGTGASRVDLSTAVTNTVAQPLYESMGYERDSEFFSYSLTL